MSNNMTRKGLAFGAGLALVSVGLVAPAANAAAPTLYPTGADDTSLVGLISSEFQLTVAMPDSAAADLADEMAVKITAVDGHAAQLDIALDGTTAAGAAITNAVTEVGTTLEDEDGEQVIKNATNAARTQTLTFNAAAAGGAIAAMVLDADEVSASFTVEAWLDVDASNTVNGAETSSTVTVTLFDFQELGYTLSFDTPQAADAHLTGSVSISQDLNYDMVTNLAGPASTLGADLAALLEVGLASVSAGTYTASASTTTTAAGAFTVGLAAVDVTNDADGEFESLDWSTATAVSTYVAEFALRAAGDVYAAQLVDAGGNDEIDSSEVRVTAFTTAITDVDIQMTQSSSVSRTAGTAESPTAWTVASGTLSSAMTVEVFNTAVSGAATAEAEAGATVSVTVTATALDADTVITVNGQTIADGDDPITVTGTTNSSGAVRLTIASNTGEDGDQITLAATSEGVTTATGDAGNANITLTWADSEEGTLTWWDNVGDNAVFAVEPGDTFDLTYAGKDTFGAPLGSDFRLAVTYNGTTYYSEPFAAGAASVEIEDDNTASATEQVTAVVEQKSATTGNFAATAVQAQHNVSVVKDPEAAATVDASVSDDEDVALETRTLAAGDTRLNSFAGPKLASGAVGYASAGTVLSGTVTDADGAGVAGAVVTIASTGLAFEADGNYTLDTITVRADGAGFFSGVTIRSATGGTKTVTVTSGSVSDSVEIAFDGSATISEDATLSISAPATATPGSVVSVEVTLLDENGNALAGDEVSFSNTGPGYLNAVKAVTGPTGKASVKLLVGSSETGTAEVTALVDYAAGKFITATATITVAAAAAPEAPAADTKVNAGSFKGYVALYAKGYAGKRMSAKVGKDWVVVESLASNFERVVEYTGAGYTISVPIYIDRVLVDTIVVTTK